jgi:hypothetical protein
LTIIARIINPDFIIILSSLTPYSNSHRLLQQKKIELEAVRQLEIAIITLLILNTTHPTPLTIAAKKIELEAVRQLEEDELFTSSDGDEPHHKTPL